MYVCSCFGITEQQVSQHAGDGRRTPRQIASACKAGTDCGSCVKRIQALLGRGASCATLPEQVPAAASQAAEPAGWPTVHAAAEPSAVPTAGEQPLIRAAAEQAAIHAAAEQSAAYAVAGQGARAA